MKMIRQTVVVLLFLLAAGCGGHNWKHDTLPEKAWNEDFADCLNRAETEAGGIRMRNPATRPAREGEIRYLMEKCMKAKGYYQ